MGSSYLERLWKESLFLCGEHACITCHDDLVINFAQLFWFLWYNGLLLTGLFLRVLYALFRRRFLPYPSLSELRQYRREVQLAESFSRNIILRVATSPAMNVKDMWSAFKEYRASKKKSKNDALEKSAEIKVNTPDIVFEDVPVSNDINVDGEEAVTDLLEEEHLAGPILHIANQISDIHERIKK